MFPVSWLLLSCHFHAHIRPLFPSGFVSFTYFHVCLRYVLVKIQNTVLQTEVRKGCVCVLSVDNEDEAVPQWGGVCCNHLPENASGVWMRCKKRKSSLKKKKINRAKERQREHRLSRKVKTSQVPLKARKVILTQNSSWEVSVASYKPLSRRINKKTTKKNWRRATIFAIYFPPIERSILFEKKAP